MNPRDFQFLDLSGYAFTGKHAVIDLVREFRGYSVPHFEFEFILVRIQGGIRDLETALIDDWSPIRSDAAIRRFEQVIQRVGTKNRLTDPRTWFQAVGWSYDSCYRNRFFTLSRKYLQRLVQTSWKTNWPYPLADVSGIELLIRKFLAKIGIKKALDFQVSLSAPQDFLDITRDYLATLLSADVPPGTKTIVMHNVLEPFNPGRGLRYFDKGKCIIVDRDPRDNYVAGLWYRPTRLPPDKFVERYRLYREISGRYAKNPEQILRIQYEDLVLRYDETLSRILRFLGESQEVHLTPKKYFDPAVSAKNVGIWKSYEFQEEISSIAKGLPEFLIDMG